MKSKITFLSKITALLMFFISSNAFSVIIYSEDFNAGMPANMTLIDNDGLTPATNVSFVTSAWVAALDVADSAATSTSWYSPAGQSDDWMVTPSISLTAGLFLSWNGTAIDANYPDGYQVYIMSTGFAPTVANFTGSGTLLLDVAAENSTETLRIIDLDAMGFTSGNYYIAFRNNSNDMYVLTIDDILVADAADSPCTKDMAIFRTTVDEGYYMIPSSQIQPLNFTGYFYNAGSSTEIYSHNVNITGAGTYSVNASYSLASGAYDTSIIGNFTPASLGDYTITSYSSLTGDCYSPNNTLVDVITVTDTVYAREKGEPDAALGFQGVFNGLLGSIFRVVNTDDLTSVSFKLQNPTLGNQVRAVVYNTSGGTPTTPIDSSAIMTITTDSTWYTLTMLGGPVNLAAGQYFIGIRQLDSNNVSLGTNSGYFEEGAGLYNGGTGWYTVEAASFYVTYALRANFGSACNVGNPSTTGANRCGTGNLTLTATLGANGTGLNWYTTPSGITPFNTGTSYTASFSSTTTYYVATEISGVCESARIPVTATVNTVPTAVASADTAICAGGTANINATGGGTYSWNNSLGAGASKSVSPSTSTTYTVTVTATNGCTATDDVVVSVNANPTANAGLDATICSGQSTIISATGGGTYSWDNSLGTGSSKTVTPTTTTTYNVTVTSGAGCTDSDAVTVFVNASPVANAGPNDTICNGESSDLIATGGGTYSWDNGLGAGASHTVSPTSTTTYTVTVTSNGCSATDDATIIVYAVPSANAGVDETICTGGSANLNASGGTSYNWDNGLGSGASHTVSPATTTVYTVTVTNANGCTNTDNMTVTVNASPTANAGSDVSICDGNSTNITATGGVSYNWDNGLGSGATHSVSPTDTTTYTVTVTASNGCTATDMVTVNVKALPVASAGNDVTICTGASAQLDASGGVSYNWNNGLGAGQSQIVTPSSTTTYIVTVTGANGCTATDNVTVSVNPIPGPSAVAGPDTSICAGNSVTISASGGINYAWDNGLGSGAVKLITPSTTTTYTVTVTDGNGCSDIASVNVIVNPSPTASLGPDTSVCDGESITLVATGGTSYSWDNGLGTGATKVISPTSTTVYVVTAMGANGCTDTDDILVTVDAKPAKPTITLFGSDLLSSASTGNQWLYNGVTLPGATSASYTPSVAGLYSVRVTNAKGCSNTSDSLSFVLGVKEKVGLTSLELFPNPSTGMLTVTMDLNLPKSVRLKIYDLLGNEIQAFDLGTFNSSKTVLDLTSYSSGIYFVDIQIDGHSIINKVVLE